MYKPLFSKNTWKQICSQFFLGRWYFLAKEVGGGEKKRPIGLNQSPKMCYSHLGIRQGLKQPASTASSAAAHHAPSQTRFCPLPPHLPMCGEASERAALWVSLFLSLGCHWEAAEGRGPASHKGAQHHLPITLPYNHLPSTFQSWEIRKCRLGARCKCSQEGSKGRALYRETAPGNGNHRHSLILT